MGNSTGHTLWVADRVSSLGSATVLEQSNETTDVTRLSPVAQINATLSAVPDGMVVIAPSRVQLAKALMDDAIGLGAASRCLAVRTPEIDIDGVAMRAEALVIGADEFRMLRGLNEMQPDVADACRDLYRRAWRLGVHSREVIAPILLDEFAANDLVPVGKGVEEPSTCFANPGGWMGQDSSAPFVSVVISTYNRASFIRESIESVLRQTFADIEVVVVDDGSTDDTRAIVASIEDSRVRYVYQENGGIAVARNLGTTVARGRYIAVHDDDDIMMPRRIELGLAALGNGFDASFGSWANVEYLPDGPKYTIHYTRERLDISVVAHVGQSPGHATWLVPKWLLEEVPYDMRLTSAVDHNVSLRSLRLGVRWKNCGEVVLLRQMHDGQVSTKDSARQSLGAARTKAFMADLATEDSYNALAARHSSVPPPKLAEPTDPGYHFDHVLPRLNQERAVVIRWKAYPQVRALGWQSIMTAVGSVRGPDGRELEEAAILAPAPWDAIRELSRRGIRYELFSMGEGEEAGSDRAVEELYRYLYQRHQRRLSGKDESGKPAALVVARGGTRELDSIENALRSMHRTHRILVRGTSKLRDALFVQVADATSLSDLYAQIETESGVSIGIMPIAAAGLREIGIK